MTDFFEPSLLTAVIAHDLTKPLKSDNNIILPDSTLAVTCVQTGSMAPVLTFLKRGLSLWTAMSVTIVKEFRKTPLMNCTAYVEHPMMKLSMYLTTNHTKTLFFL